MSYEKEIPFKDYIIVFEYDIDDDNNGFLLLNWTAFENTNEILIPCSIESTFIEHQLEKWLNREWLNKSSDYILDQTIDKLERRLSFMEDR